MTAALWLLLLVPLVIGIVARRRLRRVYARYRRVPNRVGATGAQLARAMLDAHGLRRIGVEAAPGVLTDHYDARAGVVRLSDAVAHERSVVSLAVAAHEAAHAYQDAEGSRAYRIRRSVGEPLARVAPWSGFFFIGGFFFGVPVLMYLSLAYVAGLVLFALATLPVELGASRRALSVLRRARLADAAEQRDTRAVLTAAALTYFVGLLWQVGTFLALVFLAEAAHRMAGAPAG